MNAAIDVWSPFTPSLNYLLLYTQECIKGYFDLSSTAAEVPDDEFSCVIPAL
jgi:hypothetical protein